MNSVKSDETVSLESKSKKLSELKPRKFRFGKYKRGKKKSQESRNLSKLAYFKSPVLPKADEPIGLDAEYVRDRKTNKLLPGWVALSIYSSSKKIEGCIFQSKIYHKESDVDRMEKFSGITRAMIREGRKYEQIKPQLKFFLDNFTIVGAGIVKDLEVLGLPEYRDNCIDIQDDFRDHNNQPIDLKTLSYALLNKRIQSFDDRRIKGHNPIIDSRMAVKLYKRRKEGLINSESDEESGSHSFEFCRKAVREDETLKKIWEDEKSKAKEQRLKSKRKRNKDRKTGKSLIDWPEIGN